MFIYLRKLWNACRLLRDISSSLSPFKTIANFLIDDAQGLVQIFGVEIYIDAFLSVLFIFMKYDQNCHLYRWQNNWINLFEMRETDALSGEILSR